MWMMKKISFRSRSLIDLKLSSKEFRSWKFRCICIFQVTAHPSKWPFRMSYSFLIWFLSESYSRPKSRKPFSYSSAKSRKPCSYSCTENRKSFRQPSTNQWYLAYHMSVVLNLIQRNVITRWITKISKSLDLSDSCNHSHMCFRFD